MSFLFSRTKPKTLPEVVYALNKVALKVDQESSPQAAEETCRLLAHLRSAIWGTDDGSNVSPVPTPSTEEPLAPSTTPSTMSELRKAAAEPDQIAALAKEVYATNALVHLVVILPSLDFDARRDVASLTAFLLKRPPTVEYLLRNGPRVFETLIRLAGDSDVHRTAGSILRECAKYRPLVEFVLELQQFWTLFSYVDDTDFEVATDAFSTLQDLLRSHPDLTHEFLDRRADYFSQCMNGLMRSPNYVAKRQSLRLLYELIRQKRNHNYMIFYVENLDNLKLVMRLMKDRSKNIHYEAFQLFKVFVANPHKPPQIINVLSRNKSRLLDVLGRLQGGADRKDETVFNEERKYVVRKISMLPDVAATETPETSPSRSRSASDLSLSPQASPYSPRRSPQRSPQRSPGSPGRSPQRSAAQWSPHQSPERSPRRSAPPLGIGDLHLSPNQSPRTHPLAYSPLQSPHGSQQSSPQGSPQRSPQHGFLAAPTGAPSQQQIPIHAYSPRPPSPSRAQIPAALNLGQALPSLSKQRIPDIPPQK